MLIACCSKALRDSLVSSWRSPCPRREGGAGGSPPRAVGAARRPLPHTLTPKGDAWNPPTRATTPERVGSGCERSEHPAGPCPLREHLRAKAWSPVWGRFQGEAFRSLGRVSAAGRFPYFPGGSSWCCCCGKAASADGSPLRPLERLSRISDRFAARLRRVLDCRSLSGRKSAAVADAAL